MPEEIAFPASISVGVRRAAPMPPALKLASSAGRDVRAFARALEFFNIPIGGAGGRGLG